jgi:hypothetical protein
MWHPVGGHFKKKQLHMLRHYFRIAFRNLGRHKVLTVINILGLSLGLACFSLILVGLRRQRIQL